MLGALGGATRCVRTSHARWGRACGPGIVQLGDDSDGRTTRWRFVERAPDAFRWLDEYLSSDDGEWNLEADFRAQRVTP